MGFLYERDAVSLSTCVDIGPRVLSVAVLGHGLCFDLERSYDLAGGSQIQRLAISPAGQFCGQLSCNAKTAKTSRLVRIDFPPILDMWASRANRFLFSKVFALCRSEDRIQAFSTKKVSFLVSPEVLTNDRIDGEQH